MSGVERALLYSLAIQTGLRSAECRALVRGKLHLNESDPFVVVDAGSTNNNNLASQ